MKTSAKIATVALGLAVVLGGAASASADTNWQANHPRREEVNDRLARQNHRITVERRDGELTRGQAHALRVRDRTIRAQERVLASEHHGRLTRGEQRRLNREENGVGRRIGG
jgi:small-conductance mechanosensitive channel